MRRHAMALAFGAATVADAQVPTIPATGTRIRVESSAIVGRRATGTLMAMNQGLVTLGIGKRGTTLVVPWSRITDVGVVTRRDARTGAAFGALFGGGAALVMYPYDDEGPDLGSVASNRPSPARTYIALALPVAGALLGMRMGPEEWQPLSWRPTIDTVLMEGEELTLRLAPGSKLLVRHGNRWVKGRVVRDTGDSLTVQTLRATRAMAWSDIAQLNLQESRSRTRGAALGATLGGAYALARVVRSRNSALTEKQQIIGVSLAAGAAVGALIGRGHWTRVPIPAR